MKQKHSECGLNSCNYPECGCHLTKLRVSQKTDQVSMKTLRTPEDILSKMMDEEFPAEPEVKPYIMAEVKPYIFKLARIAQKEAWNAAVRASAKAATALYLWFNNLTEDGKSHIQCDEKGPGGIYISNPVEL